MCCVGSSGKGLEQLERTENHCVRFVLNDYKPHANVTNIKENLKWQPLECRCKNLHLKFFYNIFNRQTLIERDKYIKTPPYVSGRLDHFLKVAVSGLESFFYRIACE